MGGVAVMMLVGTMLAGCLGGERYSGKYKVVEAKDGIVSIPVSEIGTTASWYQYDYGGTSIKFFAVKDGRNTVYCNFDASTRCYRYGKGFEQSGNYMVCNNCGASVAISKLYVDHGACCCGPALLKFKIADGTVIVQEGDIINGMWYFQ